MANSSLGGARRSWRQRIGRWLQPAVAAAAPARPAKAAPLRVAKPALKRPAPAAAAKPKKAAATTSNDEWEEF